MRPVLPDRLSDDTGMNVNVAPQSHKRGRPGGFFSLCSRQTRCCCDDNECREVFAAQGIGALSASPGPINTPFQAVAGMSDKLVEQARADLFMGRFGRPDKIGGIELFMCSGPCEFMTADTLYINGGGDWR